MTTPTVPVAPALANVPNVELMHVGQWDISTGKATTFTPDDLRAAVAALDCPAVRRPVLKLGHTDPRFDGEPAIGSVWNLGLAADDRTLVGDYVGMPGWLGPVIASAYPDRSIEGWWDFECQLGHVHPFVLTAVALLGVSRPGIGTLQSLQDVASLYGVAASAEPADGTPVAVTVQASQGGPPVPNPAPTKVAASATTEDVRRAFYDNAPWSQWIEEIQLEPLQLIVIDDDNGNRWRVPVTVDAASDGEDAVAFGTPIQVVIRYEDQAAVAASGATRRVSYATRAESRPGQPPAAAPQTPAEPPVALPTQPEGADDMSDTLIKGLRERLGVTDETIDDAGLLAALDESLAEHAETPAAASTDDTSELAIVRRELEKAQGQIGELVSARASDDEARKTSRKAEVFAAAFKRGAVHPAEHAERVQLEKDYDAAPEVIERILASTATGSKFPVTAAGYGTDPAEENTDPAGGDNYWFPGARVPAGQEA